MAKPTRSRSQAESDRRAAARAREGEALQARRVREAALDLAQVSRAIAEQEAIVRRWYLERDSYVLELRRAGWSWSALSKITGVSRQALMKRVPPEPSA